MNIEDHLKFKHQSAFSQYRLGLMTFEDLNRTIARIELAWLELGKNLDELNTKQEFEVSVPVVEPVSFTNVKVGDEVYVEPAYSGPFSGESWETVTKVQPTKFKAGSQWFSINDGSAKTEPWAYHCSQLKSN